MCFLKMPLAFVSMCYVFHVLSQYESLSVLFRAQFVAKWLGVLILYYTPITTICKHISEKNDPSFDRNPT
jgi:hypothetical protein